MMKRQLLIPQCVLLGILASLSAATGETDATSKAGSAAPADVFLLRGVVADAKGPLAKKVVIVSPIDAKTGMAQTLYSIVNGQPGPMTNPQTTTDAKGAFSVKVPRHLFKETPGCAYGCTEYKAGELSLGVYTDMGGGRMSSSLEGAVIKFDEKTAIVDVGRLVLKPLK